MSILLLNTGDKVLLNDGTSNVLLNVQDAQTGITISGTHASIQTQNRPEVILQVEFSFRIKAGIIAQKLFSQATLEKLSPISYSSKTLHDAFILPISKMQFNLKHFIKTMEEQYPELSFDSLLEMATESDILKALRGLFKR